MMNTGTLTNGTKTLNQDFERMLKKIDNQDQEFKQFIEAHFTLQKNFTDLEDENKQLKKKIIEISYEKTNLKEDIDNSIKALQSSREDYRKLEEEKTSLIQFLNNAPDRESEHAMKEVESLRKENERLFKENQMIMEENTQ